MSNTLKLADAVYDYMAAQPIEIMTAERDEVVEECAFSVAEGKVSMRIVPIVGCMVDATLGILEELDTPDQNETDISRRLVRALECASLVVNEAVSEGYFTAYDAIFDAKLADTGIDNDSYGEVIEPKDVLQLASAPFTDVCWVGGGALNLLRQCEITGDLTSVIAYSGGLKKVSAIADHRAEEARNCLGFPYIEVRNLQLSMQEQEPHASFTEEAKKIIREMSGSGCPARAVTSDGYGENLFDDAWIRLVSYLLPPNATTESWLDSDRM